MYFKAFALTGRIADCLYTQGVALGYELLPFTFPFGRWPLVQGVLLWASWPSGRCCLYGLLPFTFALPFGQRFSIPLRAGDRWFRAWCFNFSKIISACVIVCTNICAKNTLYSYLDFYIFYIFAAKKKKWTNKIAYWRCRKGLQFIKQKYWAKENCCF